MRSGVKARTANFRNTGLAAGVALEHDADVLRLAPIDFLEFRRTDRGQMRQRLAMRAGQCDALIFDVQFVLA
jgi:hypothetical protein